MAAAVAAAVATAAVFASGGVARRAGAALLALLGTVASAFVVLAPGGFADVDRAVVTVCATASLFVAGVLRDRSATRVAWRPALLGAATFATGLGVLSLAIAKNVLPAGAFRPAYVAWLVVSVGIAAWAHVGRAVGAAVRAEAAAVAIGLAVPWGALAASASGPEVAGAWLVVSGLAALVVVGWTASASREPKLVAAPSRRVTLSWRGDPIAVAHAWRGSALRLADVVPGAARVTLVDAHGEVGSVEGWTKSTRDDGAITLARDELALEVARADTLQAWPRRLGARDVSPLAACALAAALVAGVLALGRFQSSGEDVDAREHERETARRAILYRAAVREQEEDDEAERRRFFARMPSDEIGLPSLPWYRPRRDVPEPEWPPGDFHCDWRSRIAEDDRLCDVLTSPWTSRFDVRPWIDERRQPLTCSFGPCRPDGRGPSPRSLLPAALVADDVVRRAVARATVAQTFGTSPADVETRVRSVLPRVRYCYVAAAGATPTSHRTLRVSLHVGIDGAVTASERGTDVGSVAVVDCVLDVVRSLDFGVRRQTASSLVTFTFAFSGE